MQGFYNTSGASSTPYSDAYECDDLWDSPLAIQMTSAIPHSDTVSRLWNMTTYYLHFLSMPLLGQSDKTMDSAYYENRVHWIWVKPAIFWRALPIFLGILLWLSIIFYSKIICLFVYQSTPLNDSLKENIQLSRSIKWTKSVRCQPLEVDIAPSHHGYIPL